MLRSIINNVISDKILRSAPSQLQTVRWLRKPRKPFWLGTAKSKRFIIHDQPNLAPEERAEILRLYQNYKTSVKSIRKYLESTDTSAVASIYATTFTASEKEINDSLIVNDEWNAASAKMREERLLKSAMDHEELAINVKEMVDQQEEETKRRVEHLVRIEKEKSKDFITRENLDQKIEECLSSHTDYNFAIDLQGNMYTGFETEMKAAPLVVPENGEPYKKVENAK